MANIVPTSNIGGMQQVKHISNHLLTLYQAAMGNQARCNMGVMKNE